ncbi:MAG TPA: LysR substrate-binding domain-containing protein [Pseudolabrys sp.]|nr:LysR substrate-binding domain-containing protein [Pseudolabrys sp.]
MITLRQLRYFAALARHRHFGRAAEDCAVTQPALSMQIRELERELGVALAERRPNDVILTQAGCDVVERAEAILAAAQDLVDIARHRGAPLRGALRLGVIPTVAPYVLPRLLPELQRRYPELKLHIRETQTPVLLEELAEGVLDVVMLALPLEGGGFDSLPLFEDRFLFAVPAAHHLPETTRVDVDTVDPRDLILLEEGHCLRDQALAFCTVNGRSLPVATHLGASSLATVTQMVASGYGVTLLPEIAVGVELRDERVRVIRFRDPEPRRVIGLAWRKTSPRVADFRALGEATVLALDMPGCAAAGRPLSGVDEKGRP